MNFIADAAVLNGKGTASIVEYHSNQITRVVHSSMVAERASMVGAADRLLFNRKLLEALWHGDVDVQKEWRVELKIPGCLLTYARSLYDYVHSSSTMASERQTALDILGIKQMVFKVDFFD